MLCAGEMRIPPVGPDRLAHSGDDLDREPCAVLRCAAVGVGAGVGRRREELVDQVAVGGVDLDAVEPCGDRLPGGVDVLADDACDLVRLERARGRVRLRPLGGDHVARRGDRARRDDLGRRLVVRVPDAPGVHELHDDVAAALVHRVRDGAPAGDLLVGMHAGGVQVALPDRARLGALGDDEAEPGALPVVLDRDVLRNSAVAGAVAGQRRHHDAVGEGHRADGHGLVEAGHGGVLLQGSTGVSAWHKAPHRSWPSPV